MLSASFRANFSELYSELDKAKVRFKDLSTDATDVQKSVSAIADRFSGRNVIAQAAQMAEAIEQIGGAAMLTEREAARVNATLTQALQKAKLTGAPVTDEMKSLAAATADAGKQGTIYSKVMDGLGGAAKTAAASFAAMFAAQKIAEMAKAIVDFGGEMTDLASKTGLSTTALQQFQYAGGQVGVSLDTITGGVNQLQKRLAGDDKSAHAAIQQLGLSFNAFKALSPEQQFSTLAEKVGAIEDPMLRVKAATDLFGKAGVELLPALTKDFADLTEKANSLGIVMDEQTIASMDTLGDTVSDLGSVAFAALGKIIAPLIPLLSKLAEGAMVLASFLGDKLGQAVTLIGDGLKWLANQWLSFEISFLSGVQKVADAVPGLNSLTGASDKLGSAIDVLKGMQVALNAEQPKTATTTKAVAVEMDAASTLTKKQRAELEKYGEALTRVAGSAVPYSQTLATINGQTVEAVKYYLALGASASDLANVYGLTDLQIKAVQTSMELARREMELSSKVVVGWSASLGTVGKQIDAYLPSIGRELGKIPTVVSKALPEVSNTFGKFKDLAKSSVGGLNDIFQKAFEGGGGIGGAVKSMATQMTSGLLSMIPAVGPILSQFSGAIVAGISKIGSLFSNAGKKTNDLRDAFVSANGGLAALNEKAAQSGVTLDELLKAERPEDFQKAVQNLEAAFKASIDKMQADLEGLQSKLSDLEGQMTPTWQEMEQAAKDFGVSVDALGPAFQQLKSNARATEIVDAFETMKRGGADVGGVLVGMQDELQKFVDDSIKFGTTVPENMRPLLDELVKSGRLTDDQGNKLKDLSGIKFGEPVQDKFSKIADEITKVTDAIKELVDKLATALPNAIRNVPAVNVPVRFRTQDNTDTPDTTPDAAPRALGSFGMTGRWWENFGGGKLMRLHGTESVIRPDQARAFADSVGGGDTGGMVDELRNLRGDMMLLPQALSRAVRDAMLVAG